VLLAGIARQWSDELPGSRIDKAWSPDPHRIDLGLRTRGRDARLTFVLRPGEARCHPAADAPPNPAVPTGFCMFLRRHAVGARVLAVEHAPGERVVTLRLGSESELGEREERQLRFEGFGPRPNLILVDGRQRVMDAFRRVSAAGEGGRAILPGMRDEPPAPGGKLDPFALGVDGIVALATGAAPIDRLADLLVARLRGVAPVWARETLARAGLATDSAGRDAAGAEGALREAVATLLDLIRGEAPDPCVAYGPDGVPLGAFPVAPAQFGPHPRLVRHASIGEAVAAFHGEHQRRAALEQRRAALLRELDKRRKRLGQKLARQDAEWREAEDDLALRHVGELLLAHAHAIPAGADSVEVEDWEGVDANGRPARVRLALDRSATPTEMAERAFARYRKARRRHDALAGEIGRGRAEMAYMETVEDGLRRADALEVVDSLGTEVAVAGALGPPPGVAPVRARTPSHPVRGRGKTAGGKAGTPAPAPFHPLAYRTPGGFEVLVGRTGPENDRLSLRVAAPDDLWFHVAHGAGAHAVLRGAGATPGPATADLEAAAMLAAFHSPQRSGSHVEVDRCRAARLRKAPGARPGLLLYDREGSLSVTPDPAAVEAMRAAADRVRAVTG